MLSLSSKFDAARIRWKAGDYGTRSDYAAWAMEGK